MAGGNGVRGASPQQVRVHDFLDQSKGKAIPYGVYDLARNAGWVSVGIDHDTASLRGEHHPPLVEGRWDRKAYPQRRVAADHRRQRRQQRQSRPAVEVGAPAACRRNRA